MKFFTHADYCTKIRGNLFSAAVEVQGRHFKYLWGSVYKFGKGEIRTGEKKKKGKRRKGEKWKRRIGEKQKKGKGEKQKRGTAEKEKKGKGEK